MKLSQIASALAISAFAFGCSGSSGEGDIGGFRGDAAGGFTSAGSAGTSGSQGSNTLEGTRAFTTSNASAEQLSADGGALIAIDNGPAGCNPGDAQATEAVRISLPGGAAIGSYSIDGGAAVAFFDFLRSAADPELTALSGTVFINRKDDIAVGGNFDVILAWPDGGIDSELAGIFQASPCF